MNFFTQLFESDFMPHGHCYQWQPDILWLHVISDSAITLAYAAIPLILAWFVRKRADLAFRWVFILFSLFILLCGATHALEVWSVWHGTYRLTGVVKALTGIISLSTAWSLLFMVPKALRIPSPRELELANKRLVEETKERINAESELAVREKEELFKVMVEASPNGFLLVSKEGKIELANSAAERLFGFSEHELEGVSLDTLIPGELRGQHEKWVPSFFENPSGRVMARGRELYGLTKRGTRVPVEIGLNPLQWKGQIYTLASTVDISERHRQKRLLDEAHQRFDRAVAGAMDGLWEWHIDENEVWMSDQFFQLLGYDPEKETASFDFWADRIHPDDKEEVMAILDDHLKQGEPYVTEHRLLCGDGVYRWVLSRGNTFKGIEGNTYVSGSLSVIQRRKDAEQDLAEKTTFLDTIYKGIQHGIFVIDVTEDDDFVFAAFNPAEEKLTGIPFEDARGKKIVDLVPKYFPMEIAEAIRGNYQRCVDERQQIKYSEMIPIKGRETWWITHLTPLFDTSKRIYRIIGSASDITDFKQMEQKIRESEEYAHKILSLSLNGLYIFDLEKNANTFINPAYSMITGYTLQDLGNMENLMDLFHPDDVERIITHITGIAESTDNLPERIEYRFRHKDGYWIWCLSNDAVFTRVDGKVREMIGTFIDITQIKDYGQKLEESNQELEQFAFIASHDLREPLRKIKAFGDLLVSRFKDTLPERGQDYVDRMASAAGRLDQMISDLLSFSRVSQSQVTEMVDLGSIVATVVGDLGPRIMETHAVIDVGQLPTVEGDPNHLYQLFLNLIGNAVKYKRESVDPEISISYDVRDRQATITVQDNGIGIPEDKTEEVFHIFKRLHGRSEFSGNGIGLAICKKIVDRHGGSIWVEPRQDQPGSKFIVAFPSR